MFHIVASDVLYQILFQHQQWLAFVPWKVSNRVCINYFNEINIILEKIIVGNKICALVCFTVIICTYNVCNFLIYVFQLLMPFTMKHESL